jgi:DNA polymerase III sliding clamp (beta) subunit (PCNA family)
MKITAKKLVIQSLVEKAGAVVTGSCREILPVLKNFHIEARAGERPRLRVVATDLDLAVIADTEMVVVDEPGDSIVPAKKMLEMVKEAGDVDMTLATNGEVATIVTPTTSWSMQLMKDRYPDIPESEGIQWYDMDADKFSAGLKKVRNAISSDLDKRPELTLVRCSNDGIFATDGGRLHMSSISVPIEFELPSPAVDDLVRMMRGLQNGVIRIGQTESHILFEIANNVLIATKLQVQFPPVTHILNSKVNNNMELQVAVSELQSAIKRARITADDETNRITLRLQNHSLSVETRDKMGNSCKEVVNVHWPHPAAAFATNYIYLQQAIQDMESPNIRLLFGPDRGKQKAPIVIEEANFTAIINQLRLADDESSVKK